MPADYKVLVLPTGPQTAVELAKTVRTRKRGAWLEVLGVEWKSDALELSRRFETSAVWWSMQTPIDRVWMFAFQAGAQVRELRFSAEQGGWAANTGVGLPFEDAAALSAWLKKWQRPKKKAPLAARDGLVLLDAFLGKPAAKPKPRKRS